MLETDFIPLGTSHLVAIVCTFLITTTIYYITTKNERVCKKLREIHLIWILTLALIGVHLAFVVYCLKSGLTGLEYLLPLHTCELSMFLLVAYCLTERKPQIQKHITYILYYWLMLGGIVSLFMPDTFGFGFPHFIFIQTFIYHGLQLIIGVYITASQKVQLPAFSILVAYSALLVVLPFVALVDSKIDGANYMFLNENVEGIFSFINAYQFGPIRLLIMSICVLLAFSILWICYWLLAILRSRLSSRPNSIKKPRSLSCTRTSRNFLSRKTHE
ncbi:MAG: YwaF family protein [Candidatus Ancillula sp.]|nr:YwaF family protein [Candidatus Ancillula sp.]